MTNRKYFGTDGVRGVANQFPMTPEIAMRVGQAVGQVLRKKNRHERPTVLIGKDTRLSGYMVESALQAGFTSVGFYVLIVGPVPTPAVAFLTRSLRADVGVMISASHNPFNDNGIKLFGADGFKLDDEKELEIEELLEKPENIVLADSDKIGKAVRLDDAAGRYIEGCKTSIAGKFRLDGMRIVVDCANGASYKIAPKLLWELGAQVIRIGASPDGFNINRDCGALHTDRLQKAVKEHGADIGIALDGDADRLMICDENGRILDGDEVMAALAVHLKEEGRLEGDTVVATLMSNMGLEKYLKENGINLVRTKVGDRHVMEAMREGGFVFGGEASGHLIFLEHSTTGDGLLAALQFLEIMKNKGCSASSLGNLFEPYPQKTENVRLESRDAADAILAKSEIVKVIANVEKALGANGRVLIRKSGTEPVIRVMVEAADADTVAAHVETITSAIAAA